MTSRTLERPKKSPWESPHIHVPTYLLIKITFPQMPVFIIVEIALQKAITFLPFIATLWAKRP